MCRHRARQRQLGQHRKRRGAHHPQHLLHPRIDRGNTGHGVEIDDEQHQRRRQHHLGHQINAEPDDDQRRQRHLGDREQAEHHRAHDLGAPRDAGDHDRQRQSEADAQHIAERHLDQRPFEVPPQRAVGHDLVEHAQDRDRIAAEEQRVNQRARGGPPCQQQRRSSAACNTTIRAVSRRVRVTNTRSSRASRSRSRASSASPLPSASGGDIGAPRLRSPRADRSRCRHQCRRIPASHGCGTRRAAAAT